MGLANVTKDASVMKGEFVSEVLSEVKSTLRAMLNIRRASVWTATCEAVALPEMRLRKRLWVYRLSCGPLLQPRDAPQSLQRKLQRELHFVFLYPRIRLTRLGHLSE